MFFTLHRIDREWSYILFVVSSGSETWAVILCDGHIECLRTNCKVEYLEVDPNRMKDGRRQSAQVL
jgi:hypothetical protein